MSLLVSEVVSRRVTELRSARVAESLPSFGEKRRPVRPTHVLVEPWRWLVMRPSMLWWVLEGFGRVARTVVRVACVSLCDRAVDPGPKPGKTKHPTCGGAQVGRSLGDVLRRRGGSNQDSGYPLVISGPGSILRSGVAWPVASVALRRAKRPARTGGIRMADTRVTRVPPVASLDRWLSVANATAERPVHDRTRPSDRRGVSRLSVDCSSTFR